MPLSRVWFAFSTHVDVGAGGGGGIARGGVVLQPSSSFVDTHQPHVGGKDGCQQLAVLALADGPFERVDAPRDVE